MEKLKTLFLCTGNSCRNQMAETFLNERAGDLFAAESAGLEPTEPNPLAVSVMREVGHDISTKKSRRAFELFKQGQIYCYVITV